MFQILRSTTILLLLCALVPSSTLASLVVRDIHSTGRIDSLGDADALIAGNGIESETTVFASLIDYQDRGDNFSPGNFSYDNAFPNDTPGVDDNDFVIHVTGSIFAPTAGTWTFNVNSDDGSRLRVNNQDIIVDDSLHPPRDYFGSVNLSSGWHSIDFVYFERGGGASVELAAAFGNFSSFSAADFRLIGDTANGGLLTANPEPGSALMFGCGCFALFFRRRRS